MLSIKRFLPFLILLLMVSSVFGASTLSLDQVDYSVNDGDFNKAWLLLVTDDGRSDSFIALQGSQIKDGDVEAQNSVNINTYTKDNACEYVIKTSGTTIDKVSYEEHTYIPAITDDVQKKLECENNGGTYFRPSFAFKYYCVYRTIEGYLGYVDTKTYSYEVEIKTESAGQSKLIKLSNTGAVSGEVPNFMIARLHGGLSTGTDCPDLNSAYPIYNRNTGEWYTASKFDVDQYIAYQTTFETEFLEEPQFAISTFNNKATKAIDYEPTKVADSPIYRDKTASQTSVQGKLIAKDVFPYLNPVYSLKINADWIGVKQFTTKPVIKSISSPQFKQGTTGYIVAEILNGAGGKNGAMSFDVQCQSPFSSTGSTLVKSFLEGESKILNFPITGASTTSVNGNCELCVQDETDPSIKTCKTVVSSMTNLKICDTNQVRCNGQNVESCEDNNWKVEEKCDTFCELDDSKPKCAVIPKKEICYDNIDNDFDGKIDCEDSECSYECNGTKKGITVLPVAIVFAIIFSLYIIFWVSKIIPKSKVKKWIIGIILILLIIALTIIFGVILKWIVVMFLSVIDIFKI